MRRDRSVRILAEGITASNDTWRTGLNNNTLVIGPSGAGKTRGYVIPNILASEGSIVVTDTKGELYEQLREQLEQKGAAFQNKQKYDMRLSYVAPVLISVLMVLLMAGFMVMMAWTAKFNPDEAPPLAFTVIIMAMPLAVIGGVIYALLQRIGEIKKGEMDDARKY